MAYKEKNENPKSEGITFRLDSIVLNEIRNEAEQKDISISTLLNQIIRDHTDWHSNAAKAGFVSIRRGLIVKLMEKISEQDVVQVGECIARNEIKDFVLLLRNEYNIESSIDVMETWIRISGYPYRHEASHGIHSYIIQHDMGMKMSIYLQQLYRVLFEEFELEKVDFDMTENVLSFIVDTEYRSIRYNSLGQLPQYI
jgi:hypothetical protein